MDDWIKEETIPFHPQTYGYYNSWLGGLRRFDSLKYIYKEHKFKGTSWSQYLENNMFAYVKDKIVYNAVVSEIDFSSQDSTKVTLTKGEQYAVAKVICTVPVSILKRGTNIGGIAFQPTLSPQKQNALDKTTMKAGFKVAIEFKERFYLDVSYDHTYWYYMFWMSYGVGADREYFDALLGKGLDRNVLGVYVYGPMADEWAQLDDHDIFKNVMKKLDMMYDGKATANYVQHMVKNWSKEPHIWGASSNVWHAGLMDKTFGKEPLEDRVFFAGEFVGGQYGPTVHGACLTGRRAALNALGKEYDF